jgi:hypothetical protein
LVSLRDLRAANGDVKLVRVVHTKRLGLFRQPRTGSTLPVDGRSFSPVNTIVMKKLQQEKLLINMKKSSFMKKELIYLGFVISANELKMDPGKVDVIKNWPSPRNIFEVRSFHGLASFYRKFIRNFSGISAAMMDTVKKWHTSFHWTTEAENIFNLLKRKITERPMLVLPDF